MIRYDFNKKKTIRKSDVYKIQNRKMAMANKTKYLKSYYTSNVSHRETVKAKLKIAYRSKQAIPLKKNTNRT